MSEEGRGDHGSLSSGERRRRRGARAWRRFVCRRRAKIAARNCAAALRGLRSAAGVFFQVAFPAPHVWAGWSLAAFRCVAEEDDVPNPLTLPVGNPWESGFAIPAGALTSWQDRFRLIAFPTASAVPAAGYPPIVSFQRWLATPAADDAGIDEDGLTVLSRLGGVPAWVQDDEAPGSYGGAPMEFLFQLAEDFEFLLMPAEGGHDTRETATATNSGYDTFLLGNACYFFGTVPPAEPTVYVVMQN